ncbi:hypothetical protein ACFVJW_11775 [Streptomyces libani]|uniref:hypothetical protein n=1 Tax=Streptomyces nigrescens TaxID=1920 RepID=UPI003627243F
MLIFAPYLAILRMGRKFRQSHGKICHFDGGARRLLLRTRRIVARESSRCQAELFMKSGMLHSAINVFLSFIYSP